MNTKMEKSHNIKKGKYNITEENKTIYLMIVWKNRKDKLFSRGITYVHNIKDCIFIKVKYT